MATMVLMNIFVRGMLYARLKDLLHIHADVYCAAW